MGRVEWLRNIGISYKWMEENGIMLPVVSLNINYKTSPLWWPVNSENYFKSQSTVKIEFDYEIYNEQRVVNNC
jgi:acyl-CoA thioester hydrolase